MESEIDFKYDNAISYNLNKTIVAERLSKQWSRDKLIFLETQKMTVIMGFLLISDKEVIVYKFSNEGEGV